MIKRVIAVFFAGAIASITGKYVSGALGGLIPGPIFLGQAIIVGARGKILAALLERIGL